MADRPDTAAEHFRRVCAGEDPLVALQDFLDGWKRATPQDRPGLLSDAIPDAGDDEGKKQWALLWALAAAKLNTGNRTRTPPWASEILDEFDADFEQWLAERRQPAPTASALPPGPSFAREVQQALKSASGLLERLNRMEELPNELDAIERELVRHMKKVSERARQSSDDLETLLREQDQSAVRSAEARRNERQRQRGWLRILETARDEHIGDEEGVQQIEREIVSQKRHLDLRAKGDSSLERADSLLAEQARRRWRSSRSDLDAIVWWRRWRRVQSGLFRLLQIGPSFALLGIYIDHTAREGLHLEGSAALLASVVWWLGGEGLRRPVENWLARLRKETLRRSTASLSAIRINILIDEAAARGLRF